MAKRRTSNRRTSNHRTSNHRTSNRRTSNHRTSNHRTSNPRTYTVYIIELSRDCLRTPCAFAPLYVGQTAHTPEQRFDQHKAGGRLAASMAHRFGIRLRLDLMKGLGPFSTRNEAEAAEKAVAEALEKRGHRVFWG